MAVVPFFHPHHLTNPSVCSCGLDGDGFSILFRSIMITTAPTPWDRATKKNTGITIGEASPS
ncbi:hypothetical protein ACFLWZ_08755 [Chloroflexota bacterium]